MPAFQHHLFVCTNERPSGHPRGCCSAAGAVDLRDYFKSQVAALGLKPDVRVNAAGCLNQCEHGPTVVVYPEGVWYGFVTRADVDEIIEAHLQGGRPVQRLRLDPGCLNTASCLHRP
jgi:(2Fe-2S) ferredoxin